MTTPGRPTLALIAPVHASSPFPRVPSLGRPRAFSPAPLAPRARPPRARPRRSNKETNSTTASRSTTRDARRRDDDGRDDSRLHSRLHSLESTPRVDVSRLGSALALARARARPVDGSTPSGNRHPMIDRSMMSFEVEGSPTPDVEPSGRWIDRDDRSWSTDRSIDPTDRSTDPTDRSTDPTDRSIDPTDRSTDRRRSCQR